MTKPPIQQPKQQDPVKTAVRMSPSLHKVLKQAAEENQHSLNDEMLARLNTSLLEEITKQNEEIKTMLRQVLAHLRS